MAKEPLEPLIPMQQFEKLVSGIANVPKSEVVPPGLLEPGRSRRKASGKTNKKGT